MGRMLVSQSEPFLKVLTLFMVIFFEILKPIKMGGTVVFLRDSNFQFEEKYLVGVELEANLGKTQVRHIL